MGLFKELFDRYESPVDGLVFRTTAEEDVIDSIIVLKLL